MDYDYSALNNSNVSFVKMCIKMMSDPLPFTLIINQFVVLILGSVGFVTSILSMVVFSTLKPKLNRYLMALTLWNALDIMCMVMLFSVPMIISGQLVPDGKPFLYLYPYFFTISGISTIGGVWTLIAMCIDRYFAVCHPIKHRILLANHKRCLGTPTLVVAAVFAIILGIPKFFELDVMECWNEDSTGPVPILTTTDLYHMKSYSIGYRAGIMFFAFYFIPCLILLILTLRITYSLKKSRSFRKGMTISKILEMNATVIRQASTLLASTETVTRREGRKKISQESGSTNNMTIIVMLKFQIAHIPTIFIDILEIIANTGQWASVGIFLDKYAQYILDISNLLIVLNISTDFLVYLYFGRQFRGRSVQLLQSVITCSNITRAYSIVTNSNTANVSTSISRIQTPRSQRRSSYKYAHLNRNEMRQFSVRVSKGASPKLPDHLNTCVPYHFSPTLVRYKSTRKSTSSLTTKYRNGAAMTSNLSQPALPSAKYSAPEFPLYPDLAEFPV